MNAFTMQVQQHRPFARNRKTRSNRCSCSPMYNSASSSVLPLLSVLTLLALNLLPLLSLIITLLIVVSLIIL